MIIAEQEEFSQKVECIINALLSHDITRADAIKCLSSVIVIQHNAGTAQAHLKKQTDIDPLVFINEFGNVESKPIPASTR